MTFRIPTNERRLSQPNSSDVNGNLYQTRNISLDEEGYIKLAPATVKLYSEDDAAPFINIDSISIGSSVYLLGNEPYRTDKLEFLKSNISSGATTDSNLPENEGEGDGVYFNGKQVSTDQTDDKLKYLDGTTWVDIVTVSSTAPGVVSLFPAQNSLLYARGNIVKRINTSWAVAQTLTLPSEYTVTSMEAIGNYVYLATHNKNGGDALLFLWTGINTTNDGAYSIGTYSIQTLKKYGSTVVVVDSLGRLQVFSGSGFTELAAFPPYFVDINWGDASNEYLFITNRGMIVDGDLIYFNIANSFDNVDTEYLPNMIGDIWVYDPKVGLYQKYSSTNNEVLYDTSVDAGDINTTTNIITVSGMTIPATGSPVYYDATTSVIGGLIELKWYYTIKVTSTTFKVAETYKDAMEGNAIDITSTSSGNRFYFVSQNDYGLGITEKSHAIQSLNNDDINAYQLGSLVFISETVDRQSTSKFKLIGTCRKIRNLGYFVTPKMFASGDNDIFKDITLRFRPLKYGDSIKVKYRTTEKIGFPVMPRSRNDADNFVSWTDSTTFTTVSSPTRNFYDFSSVSVGDEVEIINGAGSGFIAHVSSIEQSGYQYTVTLTEANPFYVSGDTSMVKIDNWKMIETIDGSTFAGTEKTIAVDATGGWVQFKVIMEGTDVAIYDTVVTNKTYAHQR